MGNMDVNYWFSATIAYQNLGEKRAAASSQHRDLDLINKALALEA